MASRQRATDFEKTRKKRGAGKEEAAVYRAMVRRRGHTITSRSSGSSGSRSRQRQITISAPRQKSRQTVFKVLSYLKDPGDVRACLAYVARDRAEDRRAGTKQPIIRDEMGDVLTATAARKKLSTWDMATEKPRPEHGPLVRGPERSRLAAHISFSAVLDVDKPKQRRNFETAIDAAIEAEFGNRGHEVFWAIHDEIGKEDHPHAHIVLNLKSAWTGKTMRLGPQELAGIRERFTEKMKAFNIDAEATRREDRRELRMEIAHGTEPLRASKKHKTGFAAGAGRREGIQANLEEIAPTWTAEHGADAVLRRAKKIKGRIESAGRDLEIIVTGGDDAEVEATEKKTEKKAAPVAGVAPPPPAPAEKDERKKKKKKKGDPEAEAEKKVVVPVPTRGFAIERTRVWCAGLFLDVDAALERYRALRRELMAREIPGEMAAADKRRAATRRLPGSPRDRRADVADWYLMTRPEMFGDLRPGVKPPTIRIERQRLRSMLRGAADAAQRSEAAQQRRTQAGAAPGAPQEPPMRVPVRHGESRAVTAARDDIRWGARILATVRDAVKMVGSVGGVGGALRAFSKNPGLDGVVGIIDGELADGVARELRDVRAVLSQRLNQVRSTGIDGRFAGIEGVSAGPKSLEEQQSATTARPVDSIVKPAPRPMDVGNRGGRDR